MLSDLDSDNKFTVCAGFASVLVCLFVFWFADVVSLVSSTSLCCGTSSRTEGREVGKGNTSRVDPKVNSTIRFLNLM